MGGGVMADVSKLILDSLAGFPTPYSQWLAGTFPLNYNPVMKEDRAFRPPQTSLGDPMDFMLKIRKGLFAKRH
jgi:hypothetical protein